MSLIYNSEGEVEVLPQVHDTVHELYGPFFPPEIYALLVFNVLDRELVDSIANGLFTIKLPCADSAEYHHHVDNSFKSALEKIISLFTNKLHKNIKNGNFYLQRYYIENKSQIYLREYSSKFYIKQEILDKYDNPDKDRRKKMITFTKILQIFSEYIRESSEPSEPKRPTSMRKESLDFVLTSKLSPLGKNQRKHSDEDTPTNINLKKKPSETPTEENKSKESDTKSSTDNEKPSTIPEILGHVHLCFLEMFEHINTDKKVLMSLGAALRKCDDSFEESLMILLEMMKPNLSLINGREFNNSRKRKQSSEQALNSPDKKNHSDKEYYEINLWNPELDERTKELIVLISRVFCLFNAST